MKLRLLVRYLASTKLSHPLATFARCQSIPVTSLIVPVPVEATKIVPERHHDFPPRPSGPFRSYCFARGYTAAIPRASEGRYFRHGAKRHQRGAAQVHAQLSKRLWLQEKVIAHHSTCSDQHHTTLAAYLIRQSRHQTWDSSDGLQAVLSPNT